jgi:hypothetical protein
MSQADAASGSSASEESSEHGSLSDSEDSVSHHRHETQDKIAGTHAARHGLQSAPDRARAAR